MKMATPPLQRAALSPQLSSAPTWRREPYLLVFPLGALLAWAGVLPWLLFSLGAAWLYGPMFDAIGYRAAFLPVAQVAVLHLVVMFGGASMKQLVLRLLGPVRAIFEGLQWLIKQDPRRQ